MAETSGLPTMPSTVNLGAAGGIEGDPLEYMQKIARENIESVNKNKIVLQNEKAQFKNHVLKKLQKNINQFKQIDKKYAKLAEEKAGEEAPKEEEDPFADIFGEEEGPSDEATNEKVKIAQEFESHIKIYKTNFLKKIRISREKEAKKTEEKKMEEILQKLETV